MREIDTSGFNASHLPLKSPTILCLFFATTLILDTSLDAKRNHDGTPLYVGHTCAPSRITPPCGVPVDA